MGMPEREFRDDELPAAMPTGTPAEMEAIIRRQRERLALYRAALDHIADTCIEDPDTASFACRVLDGSAFPPGWSWRCSCSRRPIMSSDAEISAAVARLEHSLLRDDGHGVYKDLRTVLAALAAAQADACVAVEDAGPCRLRCCGGEGGDDLPCAMCGHGHTQSSGSALCHYRRAQDAEASGSRGGICP